PRVDRVEVLPLAGGAVTADLGQLAEGEGGLPTQLLGSEYSQRARNPRPRMVAFSASPRITSGCTARAQLRAGPWMTSPSRPTRPTRSGSPAWPFRNTSKLAISE